jgi:4-hydroxybenzoate polyprenyltransferase
MYFWVYSLLLLLLFVVIMIMPGIFIQALIPLIAVLSYRSWINGKKSKKA